MKNLINKNTKRSKKVNVEEILPMVNENQEESIVLADKRDSFKKFSLNYISYNKHEDFFYDIPKEFDTIENWKRLEDYASAYYKLKYDEIDAGLDKYSYSGKKNNFIKQQKELNNAIHERIQKLQENGKTINK